MDSDGLIGDAVHEMNNKKADKKRKKAMKAMRNAEFTPAQRIMRDEMGKGAHRGLDMQNPTRLGAVLDDTFGPQPAGDRASDSALAVILDYDGQIILSMKQWQTVQAMMEDTYRKGYADGIRDNVLDDPLATYRGVEPRFNQHRADD
jgi:hypothetical protein